VRQFLQKIAHCDGDFLYMRFECEVSGIQELDSRVRVIASEGFSGCGNEIKIVLPPGSRTAAVSIS